MLFWILIDRIKCWLWILIVDRMINVDLDIDR